MNPSHHDLSLDENTDARLAGLIVLGLLLFLFESFIPRPLPWLKFGLSNIATLIALYWLGWREAIVVSLFRILVGAFFTGNLLTPGFFLSASGGFAAVITMIVLKRSMLFSIVAVSICGAVMHNLAQLTLAAEWLFANPVLWHLLPYLVATGVLTGAVIGWFSRKLLMRIQHITMFSP
ncbi:MAG: Gx transporter family protein [Calditrichia bacterium]